MFLSHFERALKIPTGIYRKIISNTPFGIIRERKQEIGNEQ